MRCLRRHVLVLLVAFAGLVGLIGCSLGEEDGTDGPGGLDGDPVVVDGPVGMGELRQVCDEGASLSQVPAYAGPGPHPVWLFEPRRGNDPEQMSLVPHLFEGPPEDLDPVLTAPFENVRLVACVERTGTTPTDVVCQFDIGNDAPLLRGTYRMSLREARTGQVVSTVELGAGAEGCPSSVTVDLLGAEVYSLPKEWQYYEAMRPALLWDGQGTPTVSPAPGATAARGEPVVEGSVTLRPPAQLDPTSAAVIETYRRYWLGYSAVTANGGEDVLRDLGQVASREHVYSVQQFFDSPPGAGPRTEIGPLVLTPVVNPAPDGTGYVVADCVDSTGRLVYVNGEATGETGVRYPESVVVADEGSGLVVTGFADVVPGMCTT